MPAPAIPILPFEVACAVIVALAIAAMSRRRPLGNLLLDYGVVAAAAWLGEESCVGFYRFYVYAPAWHLRLGFVPVLVPLIWPLVILSARDVAGAIWPQLSGLRRYLVVGAIVVFDASLVEVVAVRAGLWAWAEPGYLGVPIIGILGWGYFAIGVEWALSLDWRHRRWLVIPLGMLTVHGLILATWWALFRWTLRGEMSVAALCGVTMIAGAATLLVLHAKRRDHGVPLDVAAPRVIAASLFIALLLYTAWSDSMLWAHTAAVAVTYIAATKWRLAA